MEDGAGGDNWGGERTSGDSGESREPEGRGENEEGGEEGRWTRVGTRERTREQEENTNGGKEKRQREDREGEETRGEEERKRDKRGNQKGREGLRAGGQWRGTASIIS